MSVRVISGDCRAVLPTLASGSVQCCVTSPPYFGLRDYGTGTWDGGDSACDHGGAYRNTRNGSRVTGLEGGAVASERDPIRTSCPCGAVRVDQQIGIEPTLAAYIATLVAVFGEVRRVLADDGTCWLNLGDSYANDGKWGGETGGKQAYLDDANRKRVGREKRITGLKPKDLLMIPARVALALQADGWWLRSDIIWHKPNPMPESVTDRPTSAHEHVFLLTKSARYFYDAEAVKEQSITDDPRRPYGSEGAWELDGRPAEQRHGGKLRAPANVKRGGFNGKTNEMPGREAFRAFTETRNCRNVWTVATAPSPLAHFAMMPPEIAERCIKAGSRPGDTILDPFGGVGTTGLVADRLGRDAVLVELSDTHCATARARITNDCPLFGDVA